MIENCHGEDKNNGHYAKKIVCAGAHHAPVSKRRLMANFIERLCEMPLVGLAAHIACSKNCVSGMLVESGTEEWQGRVPHGSVWQHKGFTREKDGERRGGKVK